LTSYEDTGRFVAAAVARKDLSGKLVYVANEASVTELAEIYNKVRGTNFKANNAGPIEDLIK